MATVTINDLPEQTSVVGTDYVVVQNPTDTLKMHLSTLTAASDASVTAHINDTTGAHAASAISAAPSASPMIGTDVQTQLGQAGSQINTNTAAITNNTTALNNHISNPAGAHAASAVSATPTAPITGATVQAELNSAAGLISTNTTNITNNTTALNNHTSGTTAVHQASAIVVSPSGNLSSVNVQLALQELQSDIDTAMTQAAADTRYVNVTGDSMTGVLTISTDTTGELRTAATNGDRLQFDAYNIDAYQPSTAGTPFINIGLADRGSGKPDVYLPGGVIMGDLYMRLTKAGTYIRLRNEAPVDLDQAVSQRYVNDRTRGINNQSATTYAPVLADEYKMVTLSNAAAITVTMPSDATQAFPVGAEISWLWLGVGKPSFVAGSGATLNGRFLGMQARYAQATTKKIAANTWVVYGDLA